MDFQVADLNLAPEGKKRIEWVRREMPVLGQRIEEEWKENKPLLGVRISACLHVTAETAALMITLREGGAQVRLCASNPLSTQDEVAASLVNDYQIPVFAVRGEDRDTYYQHIEQALAHDPQVTMDDGADLVSFIHRAEEGKFPSVIGGTEETTTGVIRLRSLAKSGKLKYPVIAVNDALTKYLFDNRYGTGQSSIEGVLRATHILLAGKKVVVVGYGWCGRGIAARARGMGARVSVVEVDPVKALEAVMDGYEVQPTLQAAAWGEVFITATGDISVLRREHFLEMTDGAILANAGHFNVEIDISDLEHLSLNRRIVRPLVEEFTLAGGKRIYLLAEGRLVNLSCAEGHPPTVMDMSFANQALSVLYLVKNSKELTRDVWRVPPEIDQRIALLKLDSMGIKLEQLTDRQKEYLSSWEEGT
ncbi:MAG: adenosylhomocysteinase [Candidatus Atribacteria bacterium]|nr:adenosylhomocysteinase [Candidatus Atribacteria bacterium]